MKKFESSLTNIQLTDYVYKQLSNFFPDLYKLDLIALRACVSKAIVRIRVSFEPIHLRYYNKGKKSFFNHLHGDHYAAFLYFLSNELYKEGLENFASKLFLLNKALFGIDAYYGLSLPEHFLFVHPLGTILGNADYGDFFVVYQGVTVGSTTKGVYPSFGERTILYSNSSIIGECKVGDDFVLAANASLLNTRVDNCSVIVGNYPLHKIHYNNKRLIKEYYSI